MKTCILHASKLNNMSEKMLCEFKPLGKCEAARFWVADHLICLVRKQN